MAHIFDFTDFREYLNNYFHEKKRTNPSFSYQLLTEKAGFNNRGFLFNIIKGTKKLTKTHCYQLSQALGHNRKEAQYFETLVAYAQAKNEGERTFYLELIQQGRSMKPVTPVIIDKDRHEFYSKWYHSAIRSLIGIFPVGDDYKTISKYVFPPITAVQAKKSVELLIRLGLIKKDKDGIYQLTGKNLKAGDELSKKSLNRFHVECIELAKQSIIYSPSKLHFKTSVTLGISEKSYTAIQEEAKKFRERIVQIANSEKEADRVYQCQLVLFPLVPGTGTIDSEEKNE